MARAWLALSALLALSGCKEQRTSPPATPLDAVRNAVLQTVAASQGLPPTVVFRGVQTYRQAAPHHTAVCGLVSAFADDPTIFVPFVAVAAETGRPGILPPQVSVVTQLGTTPDAANRVYIALVADCWDGGGMAPGRPTPVPPLPDNLPDPRAAAVASKPPAVSPPINKPATGTVTLRQGANIHSEPGGAVIRNLPAGTVLHVFSQTADGWVQVGDAAPFGWVYQTMLDH